MRKLAGLAAAFVLVFCVRTQAQQSITLADVLSHTSDKAGPAPDKFATPFLVVAVSPLGGGACSLQVATNGMLYYVAAQLDNGECNHLPTLHSLVWGRVRHSSLGTFLRQSNMANVNSDYVDLVYQGGARPKFAIYGIVNADAIDTDWGRTTVSQPAVDPNLVAQVKTNSEAGETSEARAAAVAAGHNDTPEQMAQLIRDGKASRCLVVTNPSGADLYIDGKQAGKTPMAFTLYRHDDADRVITVKLNGFKAIEKNVSPDGKDVKLDLTLEPSAGDTVGKNCTTVPAANASRGQGTNVCLDTSASTAPSMPTIRGHVLGETLSEFASKAITPDAIKSCNDGVYKKQEAFTRGVSGQGPRVPPPSLGDMVAEESCDAYLKLQQQILANGELKCTAGYKHSESLAGYRDPYFCNSMNGKAVFRDGKLVMLGTISENPFPDVLADAIAKFGQPTDRGTEMLQNGYGARWEVGYAVWKTAEYVFKIKEEVDKDQSRSVSINYETPAVAAAIQQADHSSGSLD